MECKQFYSSLNDGDGASLGEKQHLIVAYSAISFHCTKLIINYTKRLLTSSQSHLKMIHCLVLLNETVTMVTKGSECDADIHADRPQP